MRFVMFITRAKQTWLFGFKSNKYIFVFYVEEELEHVLKHALWSFDKDAKEPCFMFRGKYAPFVD